jgi:hypothetical protein
MSQGQLGGLMEGRMPEGCKGTPQVNNDNHVGVLQSEEFILLGL